MDLSYPVTELKGVGEKRRKCYEKLDIRTVGDLLEYYPRDYMDLTGTLSLDDAEDGEVSAIKAVVCDKGIPKKIKKNLTVSKVRVTDMKKDILITFFNAKYSVEALKEGEEYIFYGPVKKTLTGGEMTSPKVIQANENGFLPIYPVTEGLSSAIISGQVKEAIGNFEMFIDDFLPNEIKKKYDLIERTDAIKWIHFPNSSDQLSKARKRLCFEEFLIFAMRMTLAKGKNRRARGIPLTDTDVSEFTENLGFEMTNAQKRVTEECLCDMKGVIPMNRLIQGDVGSGKTAVAAALMFAAAKNGFQSAIMAPTEVLATQHAETLEKFFKKFGIRTALLTGSMKPSQKADIKEKLKNGEIDVLTGTHAIIQEDVVFKNLGLIITDEQHRFGVKQRLALSEKGMAPHTLVMSATPIPRTLAFVLYGDLDISVLDEMPKNRIPVKTYLVGQELFPRVMNFIRKFAEEGKQSYIVCPLIEQGEETFPLESAADLCERIAGSDLIGIRIGLLHGKMSSGEKERVMEAFQKGDITVLVSTTVIEVGVDVPNAVCMVIENADRFGLSQLHQLRGRVGRGSDQSFCILISDTSSKETKKRLEIITKTNDGFKIAEEDLKLRGPGDFFGFRQSGMPVLKIGNMMTDSKLLEMSKKAVSDILAEDPNLEFAKNHGLLKKIEKLITMVS